MADPKLIGTLGGIPVYEDEDLPPRLARLVVEHAARPPHPLTMAGRK